MNIQDCLPGACHIRNRTAHNIEDDVNEENGYLNAPNNLSDDEVI